MSVAACKALVQLFTKPSYWEKTEHGFCTFDGQPGAAGPVPIRLVAARSAS